MAERQLDSVRVAILVADGFKQSEMEKSRAALDETGAETMLVSPVSQPKAWSGEDWGQAFSADLGTR